MSAKKPNISQIDQYLKGKLDARAMHKLERQAQDDPFLMDALQGYEQSGKDQQANLAELSERLAKRTAPAKHRSIILWRILPLAASVLVMLGLGYWFFRPTPVKKQYANVVTTEKESALAKLSPPKKETIVKQYDDNVSIADKKDREVTASTIVQEPEMVTDANKATMLNEVHINNASKPIYKKDTIEYIANDYRVRPSAKAEDVLKKMEGIEVGPDGSVTVQGQPVTKAKLNGKAFYGGDVARAVQNLPADILQKIQIVDDYGNQAAKTGTPQKVLNLVTDTLNKRDLLARNQPQQLREVSIANPVAVESRMVGRVAGVAATNNNTPNRQVTGTVLDEKGNPLMGVTVKVDGTNNAVNTDRDGNFKIELPSNKDLLAVNYVGFGSKQVRVGNQNDLKIALNETTSNLNEVVVSAYGLKPTILKEEPHLDGPAPIYKKDTIEYIADDYAVKPNATVESLLKKMTGFEVDGSSITFQGQLVTKAKLNSKDFGGGNLSAAIKTLPAETIEKVLVVSKSDQVAKTGIQPAKSELVLNLITYTNKKAFMSAKRTIRGKVTDKQGAVLIGATVRVVGTDKKGVETDANGNFKIDLPNRKDMLVADYVGHGHEHIKVGNHNNLNIILEPYKYASSESARSVINCNENPKFKTAYFYNIHIVDKYDSEKRFGSKHTITPIKFKKALLFLNKYTKVPTDKFLTDGGYSTTINFYNYRNQWLKWYEENKCSNLK